MIDKDDISNIIKEFETTNMELIKEIESNEPESQWICGYNDAFYACSLIIIKKLKLIMGDNK